MEVNYYHGGVLVKHLGEALSGCLPVKGEHVSIAVGPATYTGRVVERNFVYGAWNVVHIHLE